MKSRAEMLFCETKTVYPQWLTLDRACRLIGGMATTETSRIIPPVAFFKSVQRGRSADIYCASASSTSSVLRTRPMRGKICSTAKPCVSALRLDIASSTKISA